MNLWSLGELSPGGYSNLPTLMHLLLPFFFSVDSMELAMMGETAPCQMEKCEILYSLLFIDLSMCLNERLRTAHTPPGAILGAPLWWSTGPTFRRPFLVPGAGSVQGGTRSGSLEQLLAVGCAITCVCSKVPEHRGKGGGAAKGKVSLCFLDKFNASGSSDGDMHSLEVFTTTTGINLPGTGWAVGGVGCFTFPWHKLTTSPGPTGILPVTSACPSPAPHTHGPSWLHSSCSEELL